jgi:hypothetical protein
MVSAELSVAVMMEIEGKLLFMRRKTLSFLLDVSPVNESGEVG